MFKFGLQKTRQVRVTVTDTTKTHLTFEYGVQYENCSPIHACNALMSYRVISLYG